MKKETIRTLILMLICGAGGLLIGFNAGHMSNTANAALFVLGVVLLAMSTTLVGLFETVWKNKNK